MLSDILEIYIYNNNPSIHPFDNTKINNTKIIYNYHDFIHFFNNSILWIYRNIIYTPFASFSFKGETIAEI